MRIYLAGTFESRERLRPIRDKLFELGHQCMSSWLDEVAKPSMLTSEQFKRKLAFKDCCEVLSSDLLILDTEKVSGGKNCELGLALGDFQNKLIWCVGTPTNIFQYLVDDQFTDWEDCLSFLKEFYPTNKGSDASKLEDNLTNHNNVVS